MAIRVTYKFGEAYSSADTTYPHTVKQPSNVPNVSWSNYIEGTYNHRIYKDGELYVSYTTTFHKNFIYWTDSDDNKWYPGDEITYTGTGTKVYILTANFSDTWAYYSGTTSFTLPSISKTGYTQGNYTGTNTWPPGTTILASQAPYDTVWYANYTANSYTVTLNAQGGVGGTPSVTATYNSAMPSAIMPTKEGYIFAGYYDGENGTGTKYYNADGSSAHVWNKAGNATLYAYWVVRITIKSAGHGTATLSATGYTPISNTDLSNDKYLDFPEGTEYTVSGTASSGYVLGYWTVNGDTNNSSTITTSATTNTTYVAYFVDYYTVHWDTSIPEKFAAFAEPCTTYHNDPNKFSPSSTVEFSFTPRDNSGITPSNEATFYRDDTSYYTLNKWAWGNNEPSIGDTNPLTISINRSGTVKAYIDSTALTPHNLYTNFASASINGVTATPRHKATVKIAQGIDDIVLKAITTDPNFKFGGWYDMANDIELSTLPTYTIPASHTHSNITDFEAVYEINGQEVNILAPNDFELVAQPVYIKEGLVEEANTRFMSAKYPAYVDWAAVENNTGKKPKKGDFYFMIVNEE